MMAKIPVISLFSGCGGLDLGFRQQGFEPIIAMDLEQAAVDSYNFNQPSVARVVDLAVGAVADLVDGWEKVWEETPKGVIGGPPCQAFSIGNVHPKSDDPRANLVHRYSDIVREIDQRHGLEFFALENVGSLAGPRNEVHFSKFCREVEQAGFRIFKKILDAQWFGVPQRRARLFVVGINADKFPDLNYEFPEQESLIPNTVRNVIADFDEPVFFERKLNPDEFPVHPNHWAMRPKSKKFRQIGDRSGTRTDGTKVASGRSFRVLNWDSPSWTVAYGHREVHVHPQGHRRLSVHEAMLLQGFPSEYVLKGNLSEQIGLVSNAVPPPLAAAVAKQFQNILI